MKILIIEDEVDIATQLAGHLEQAGFVTHVLHDGGEAAFAGTGAEYDGIALDLGLPGTDGMTILRQWREAGVTTPVVVLTARTAKRDVIQALEAGADDYVGKPFDPDEVAARLRATIRRASQRASNHYSYGAVELDDSRGRVKLDGVQVALTRTEYLLVQFLFLHQGHVRSISEIADHVYDDFDHDSSIVQRHVANVRKKLGKDVIVTVANRGYMIPDANSA
ncbi:MAG: response regulator transcription factor [Pseudomonadota bacterium]